MEPRRDYNSAPYRDTSYGPQLDIRKIREVTDSDVADGFDLALFVPHSRFDPVAMFDEIARSPPRRFLTPASRRWCCRSWTIIVNNCSRCLPPRATITLTMPVTWSTC